MSPESDRVVSRVQSLSVGRVKYRSRLTSQAQKETSESHLTPGPAVLMGRGEGQSVLP